MKNLIVILFCLLSLQCFSQSITDTYNTIDETRRIADLNARDNQPETLLNTNKQTLEMIRIASPDDDLAIETWERIVSISEQRVRGEISSESYELRVNSALERLNRKRETQKLQEHQQQIIYDAKLNRANINEPQKSSTNSVKQRKQIGVTCITTGYGETLTTSCF